MSDSEVPSVPGLQHERTALAWDRTGVGFILVGLLFLRATGGLPLVWKLGSLAAVGFGSFLMVYAYRRYAVTASAEAPGDGLGAPGLMRVVGLATVALSLLSAALIIVRHA